jgi:hypothetical protein
MPFVLEDDERRADAADEQAQRHGPENQKGFTSLLPGSLMPENKFSQQVKRRMLWFDISQYKPDCSDVHELIGICFKVIDANDVPNVLSIHAFPRVRLKLISRKRPGANPPGKKRI